jgi:hypothetical protein
MSKLPDDDDNETPPPHDAGSDTPPPVPATMVGLAMGVGQLIATTHSHSKELRSIAADVACNRDAWQKCGQAVAILQVESADHKKRISEIVHKVHSIADDTGQFMVEEKTSATTRRALWKQIGAALSIAVAAAGLAVAANGVFRRHDLNTVQRQIIHAVAADAAPSATKINGKK